MTCNGGLAWRATALLIVSGCGADNVAAEKAAAAFGAALSTGNPSQACDLLAPTTLAALQ